MNIVFSNSPRRCKFFVKPGEIHESPLVFLVVSQINEYRRAFCRTVFEVYNLVCFSLYTRLIDIFRVLSLLPHIISLMYE